MKIDLIRVFFRWYLRDKESNRGEVNITNINTILVMSNTAIGDTLFATPAIKLIKKKYPEKKIVVLLNPMNYQLFDSNPYIDKIITYRGKWRNFLKVVYQLRKLDVDLTLIMHSNEPQATPLAYCIGSKFIIKIPNDQNEFKFLHYNKPIAKKVGEHFIDRRLRQLNYIGIYEKNYQMEIFPRDEWQYSIDGLLDHNTVHIGFQIGASTNSRMWFLEKWINLAKKILAFNQDWKIVLTGSDKDKTMANKFQSAVNSDRVVNLVGLFGLGPAATLIGELDLLVTPDTGPLHIAAAMGTPTIAISVAGDATESNPKSSSVTHIFIQKQKTCTPCIDKRCKYQKCMLQISTDEVFDCIKGVL
jgi:ADP-heptose:LPS heptosyltransferase